MTAKRRELDRELLRQAGEHLGMLAEQAHEQMELHPFKLGYGKQQERYLKLWNAHRAVLEIAKL